MKTLHPDFVRLLHSQRNVQNAYQMKLSHQATSTSTQDALTKRTALVEIPSSCTENRISWSHFCFNTVLRIDTSGKIRELNHQSFCVTRRTATQRTAVNANAVSFMDMILRCHKWELYIHLSKNCLSLRRGLCFAINQRCH